MTYRLPSLNTLRAFEAAARHLSFKTAASELGVTAGAVSQQVRKLEQSLGVALFRRLAHGLLLTTEGEVYLPKITKALEDLTEATEEIAPDMNGKKFTVGICPKAAALLPGNWPLNDETLKPYVRDVIETSDVERVWSNDVDCLIRVSGGSFGGLTLLEIPNSCNATQKNGQLYFICKPGFAECRQTEVLVRSLARISSDLP